MTRDLTAAPSKLSVLNRQRNCLDKVSISGRLAASAHDDSHFVSLDCHGCKLHTP